MDGCQPQEVEATGSVDDDLSGWTGTQRGDADVPDIAAVRKE
jgi:hypothetical protein